MDIASFVKVNIAVSRGGPVQRGLRSSAVEIGLQCVLYTDTMRCVGEAMANYLFLMDAMNSTNRAYVEMRNLAVSSNNDPTDHEVRYEHMLLRKEHVLLAVPNADEARDEASARPFLGERTREAVLTVGAFSLRGTLYTPLASNLLAYLIEETGDYVPMTYATFGHESGKDVVTTPYVLVRREAIALASDLSIIKEAPEEPDKPAPMEAYVGPIDADSACRILLATELFEDVDATQLYPLLRQMVEDRSVIQRGVPARSVVIREGELDDTLYVVFQGRMEVLAVVGGDLKEVAELRPGDLFGELAFLGNKRRSATVRAKSDAVILVLSSGAWKRLATDIPNITGKLMRMVASRGAPPSGGTLGSLTRR